MSPVLFTPPFLSLFLLIHFSIPPLFPLSSLPSFPLTVPSARPLPIFMGNISSPHHKCKYMVPEYGMLLELRSNPDFASLLFDLQPDEHMLRALHSSSCALHA